MDPREMRELAVREAKQGLILDAARKVFADRGYHETRLEDIAVEAGFSKASLYNYFPDKEAIFLKLAVREIDRLAGELEKALVSEGSAMQAFEAMLHSIFSVFGDHFAFMLAMAHFPADVMFDRDGVEGRQEAVATHLAGLQRLLEVLARAIARAKERGEIKSPLDATTLARYASGIVRSVLLRWRIDRCMGDIDTEVARMMEFLRGGFRAT